LSSQVSTMALRMSIGRPFAPVALQGVNLVLEPVALIVEFDQIA